MLSRISSQAPGVELLGVGKRYEGQSAGGVEALRGVDLTLTDGEFVCLIGASGCGMRTTVRSLSSRWIRNAPS